MSKVNLEILEWEDFKEVAEGLNYGSTSKSNSTNVYSLDKEGKSWMFIVWS